MGKEKISWGGRTNFYPTFPSLNFDLPNGVSFFFFFLMDELNFEWFNVIVPNFTYNKG